MNNLPELSRLVRYYSLVSTTAAGSGHPTSSMSAADVMVVLMFGGFFKADLDNPEYVNNDRLIFSKGHASPLFYSLYAVAGQGPAFAKASAGESAGSPVPLKRAFDLEELMTLRKMGSRFEGHPTMLFPYTEVPTGSLGQGLSVGAGMAINAKLGKLSYRTYVLLGDSEMAEGSVWEAMAVAAYYKLNNLVAILDCNRLGQSRETMLGHKTEIFEARARAFGWDVIVIDGHDFDSIKKAFDFAGKPSEKPRIIIARTLKGKGVSFLEDKPGKHGVALSADDLQKALLELGNVNKSLAGKVAEPAEISMDARSPLVGQGDSLQRDIKFTNYDKPTATRKAYGNALVNIHAAHPNMVVLDGETSNSTFAETFAKAYPDKYIESFIAEQNMAGMALGLSRRGKIPFASTFAAFWSRAYDQIRMSQYAHANIKFVGSHAGVSIGEDGSSQMALEDLGMFRALFDSVVLYPSDAVSTEKLVAEAAKHQGNVYIRTTRKDTAILYSPADEFPIGGSKTIRSSENDQVTVIGAGVTLHEALAAYEELKKENITIRVIDLYSIKPIDIEAIKKAAKETKAIITVEDHHHEGGLGEAVRSGLSGKCEVVSLAVAKEPHSAKPDELLAYEEIGRAAIVTAVKKVLSAQ